ncbi:MAG: hypothetical protein V8R80_00090 [Eubacterium sp.]
MEAILIGLIGSIIPLVILYAMYENIIKYVGERFDFLSNTIPVFPVNTIYHLLLPIGLLLGVGIGYIGSDVTVRKHINV